MNACACEARLTSWLLGDLPAAESEAIRRHLAECASCRELATELEPVIAALRTGLAATPAKPLRLLPSRRRRVLATPYRNRFRRWWGVHSAAILKCAAVTVILLALASAALFPAVTCSLDVARRTAARSREHSARMAPMAEDMERDAGASSDNELFFDSRRLSAGDAPVAPMEMPDRSGSMVAAVSLDEGVDVAYSVDGGRRKQEYASKEMPPPAAAPAAPEPPPQPVGGIATVKSPVILRGILGSGRAPGYRVSTTFSEKAGGPGNLPAGAESSTRERRGGAAGGSESEKAVGGREPGWAPADIAASNYEVKALPKASDTEAQPRARKAFSGRYPGGARADIAAPGDEVKALPKASEIEAPPLARWARRSLEDGDDSRHGQSGEQDKLRLADDVTRLEERAQALNGRLQEFGAAPPPPAKPKTAPPVAAASKSELEYRERVATETIASGETAFRHLRERMSAPSTPAPITPTAPVRPAEDQIGGKGHKDSATERDSDREGLSASLTAEEATVERMKKIVIPEIDFRQANLKDIAGFFEEAAKEFGDRKGSGKTQPMDFVVKTAPDVTGAADAAAAGKADPFAPAGEGKPAEASGAAPVTFGARQVSLYDAAQLVADVSGMKMRIRDGQVIYLPINVPDSDIVTRIYAVNGVRIAALAKRSGSPGNETVKGADASVNDMTPFFTNMVASLPAGSTFTYLPSVNELLVRTTPDSLVEVDRLLADLKLTQDSRGDGMDAPPPPSPPQPAAHNPFVRTSENPFSTFAIDVDTASYTLTRQALQGGALPAPESVRTEEIVNAFDYGDRAPENAVFRVYIEGAPAPFGAGLDLVRIGVKGRRLGREEQRPAMLTFLVDSSGSMDQPDRIGLARQALALLLTQLSPRDRLQLIAFDDHARLLLEATPAGARDEIMAAFDRLQCRGSTNLEEGMRQAYAQAARAFQPGAENRVILISDGVANLGSATAADILAHIAANRRQGITCSVFGVGRGAYNDEMLEQLANRGDGAYRFLDSPDEVRRAFVDDLAATLNTIAADVKIQVEWAPAAVSRYRQLGYENRALTKEQFRDDTVDAGEVGSGQSVTALYEIERAGAASRHAPLGTVRVRYRRVDTQAIEEIAQPILPSQLAAAIEGARPELRLAAGAAEFAELLRRSPHAAGGRFAEVARLLHPVALEMKLDTRVAELLRLVELAGGMAD